MERPIGKSESITAQNPARFNMNSRMVYILETESNQSPTIPFDSTSQAGLNDFAAALETWNLRLNIINIY